MWVRTWLQAGNGPAAAPPPAPQMMAQAPQPQQQVYGEPMQPMMQPQYFPVPLHTARLTDIPAPFSTPLSPRHDILCMLASNECIEANVERRARAERSARARAARRLATPRWIAAAPTHT